MVEVSQQPLGDWIGLIRVGEDNEGFCESDKPGEYLRLYLRKSSSYTRIFIIPSV